MRHLLAFSMLLLLVGGCETDPQPTPPTAAPEPRPTEHFGDPADAFVPTFDDAFRFCDALLPAYSWRNASAGNSDGDRAVVGRIEKVTYRGDVPGQPTFLDVGAPFPDGFSVVLFEPDALFVTTAGDAGAPDRQGGGEIGDPDRLEGQLICALGKVTTQDSRPQMVDTKGLNSIVVAW